MLIYYWRIPNINFISGERYFFFQAIVMGNFQSFEWRQLSLNAMTWFSFWTLFEMLMYLMFITSVFLRLTMPAGRFHNARMMYAVTLGTFIINSMQFFLVSKQIGPKVIMIGRMVSKDTVVSLLTNDLNN